jgi:cytidine deaminase
VPSPFSIGFYDPKKKIILESGNSRPCGCNHNKISIHAEQKAISYCRRHDKKHNYKIYIGRYAKDGHLKPAYCCRACSQLVTKYEFQDRIYTLKDGSFVSALKDNPEISLGYKIKHEY